MSASAASSSSMRSSPMSLVPKQQHQLPPVVHAIGKQFVNNLLCFVHYGWLCSNIHAIPTYI